MMICERLMPLTSASTVSSTAVGVRLRTTIVSAVAPARSQARAESYSQFVPGNTGMMTCGRAIFVAAVMPLPFVYGAYDTSPLTFFVCVGKIFSSGVV